METVGPCDIPEDGEVTLGECYGTGDYDGLRFVVELEGTDSPRDVSGQIEPTS